MSINTTKPLYLTPRVRSSDS